jgi:hypothetical protein
MNDLSTAGEVDTDSMLVTNLRPQLNTLPLFREVIAFFIELVGLVFMITLIS